MASEHDNWSYGDNESTSHDSSSSSSSFSSYTKSSLRDSSSSFPSSFRKPPLNDSSSSSSSSSSHHRKSSLNDSSFPSSSSSSSFPSSFASKKEDHSTSAEPGNPPIKRKLSYSIPSPPSPLATSSDSFLIGTDRTSISKLLAKRRASAPNVPLRTPVTVAQHPHTPSGILLPVERSKGASKEVYGFVCWITSFVAYAFFLLWGFLPEQLLRSMGVHYVPNKYWVVAIPSYFMVAVLFGILTYVCINLIYTDSLSSYHTFSSNAPTSDYHHHTHQEHDNTIPAATDIPLTLVNELLYQKKKPISELSPTFSKLGNVRTPRTRVYFDNKNKTSTEDLLTLRGTNEWAWDPPSSLSSLSSSTTDSAENSESEGPSTPKHEFSKRSFSPFSSSSPDNSPIRRTSSYSLLREDST